MNAKRNFYSETCRPLKLLDPVLFPSVFRKLDGKEFDGLPLDCLESEYLRALERRKVF